MRFYLELELQQPNISRDFRRCIMSYIKKVLSTCYGGKYYTQYYEDTKQKDFAFSVIFKGPKFLGDKISLESCKFQIRFSTDERSKTGMRLMNAFIQEKNLEFVLPEGNSMILKKVVQEKRKDITNSKAIFKTVKGGGLCIREHYKDINKDKYIVVGEEGFDIQFMTVLKNQALQAGFSERIATNIIFKPIDCKKIVVLHYGIYLDISVGTFEVEGDSRLIQYLYDVGMGSRKSEGFGMIDLITQDLD